MRAVRIRNLFDISELWKSDFLDMEVPAFITIRHDGKSEFQFGLVEGALDGRDELTGKSPQFNFSWSGEDNGRPKSGRGWLRIGDNQIEGRIFIHFGDNSALIAQRS